MYKVLGNTVLSVNTPVLGLLSADPTRTITLRRQWIVEMNKRFSEILRYVNIAVVERDVFGIKNNPLRVLQAPPVRAYKYLRSDVKVTQFMKDLKRFEQENILEIISDPTIGTGQEPWSNSWVRRSYKRGADKARADLLSSGSVPESYALSGSILSSPFHIDRLRLIYTRVFSDLEGITNAMNQQMSRVLARGMAEGVGVTEMARRLNNRVKKIGIVRARLLARTEVVQSLNEAALNEFDAASRIIRKPILSKWITALDERVRDRHLDRHGRVYTREEAQGLLGEPNCRCALIAFIDSAPFRKDLKRTGRERKKALALRKSKSGTIPGVAGNTPLCGLTNLITQRVERCLTGRNIEKVQRSLNSYVPSTRENQRIAIANERKLASRIKGAKQLKDNEPFDVIVGKSTSPSHLVEVKTIIVGKNNKITMRKECRLRKLKEAKKVPKAKVHTIVFDERVDKMFYSEGVGSFRLGGMKETTFGELNELLAI